MQRFPYLSDLLGGYFHQDAYDDDQDDEAIMRTFRQTSWEYQRLGVRADIRRFLHQHAGELLNAVELAFRPCIIVGSTDDDARAWLMKIDALLDERAT